MTHHRFHAALRALRTGILNHHPQPPRIVREMVGAEFLPIQAERQRARAAVLRQLGEPPQTKYFQEIVRNLDVAIEMQRGDWCRWLINYTPGYSDLLTENDRLKHGKTDPKYLELNQLLKQEEEKRKERNDDDDDDDDDDGGAGAIVIANTAVIAGNVAVTSLIV